MSEKPFTQPSPTTWTLRLRARKTTVLLHVDPLQTFASIKSQLLAALSESTLRDPETNQTITLPTSPLEFQLGRPVDRSDLKAGWVLGDWEIPPAGDEEDETGKGKGKAKAKKSNTGVGGAVKDCPKGAGLRDRDCLAFRWPGDGTGWEEEEEEEAQQASMWGVILPSFEDSFGVPANETEFE
ncbi:hypothetical protein DM02DRAFT_619265 [Periconia macrospinosa]|uniref:Uncharacterized protein n=1 Tax=Periconia macrospinosa TaxID=97972 RepID=A0A2V1D5X1_9PLEO|nr:hypothetical protein DM02DRAFT_619265 [Periconia macrospinosa]